MSSFDLLVLVSGIILALFTVIGFLEFIYEKSAAKWLSNPQGVFWGCICCLHVWEYYRRPAEVADNVELVPKILYGLHAAELERYGQASLRRCRCCNKIQRMKLDYFGCHSLTDPPIERWYDLEGNKDECR